LVAQEPEISRQGIVAAAAQDLHDAVGTDAGARGEIRVAEA
jgi:hypothetical protein